MTLTLLAPRRKELRQQSIAVLPTPMISTRSPILSRCLNAIDSSHWMPIWMLAAPASRPGSLSSLPFGAPLPMNTCVETAGVDELPEALDTRAVTDLGAHVDDVADLFGEHGLGQTEGRDVRAHETARHLPLLEDHDFVAERQQVVGDRERRRSRADARDALAVLLPRDRRQAVDDGILVVRCDTLEPADRHRLVFDAAAPAGWLAGPVTDAPEDAREHVRFPVHHVGVRELAQRDQADVFGDVGVCRTGPLAVYDPVKIVRVRGVGRLQG
jgi:hypothetical protein